MARISGVDIPTNKRGVISLTYIYGIGSSRAEEILNALAISQDKRVKEWTDEEASAIRNYISAGLTTEGELRS